MIRPMRFLGILLLSGVALAQNLSSAPLTATLPSDPKLVTGKLPNGLTYYIYPNEEPQNRAELRLVVNVGSLMEEDDQKGLAHFLEHMLFNGTKRFPKQEIENFLEKVGMQFGADLNAYTSFDETVYQLRVPTGDPATFDTALNILEDWASSATLDPDQVKREAPVIVEEERARYKTASGRASIQSLGLYLANSRYGVRLPIGDMKIVSSAPTEALRRFYQTWYRPDLMAVVVVGDVDAKKLEATLKEKFGALKNPTPAKPRPSYNIPSVNTDRYLVFQDPEYPQTQIRINALRQARVVNTVGTFRDLIINQLYASMLNSRLSDLSKSANPPFLSASVGSGNFVRPHDVDQIAVTVKENGEAAGLDAALTELKRARLGFTEGELARAKSQLQSTFEKAYNERDKQDSRDIADTLADIFLTGAAPTSAETDLELAKRFLGELTDDDVNTYAKGFLSGPRNIITLRPQKTGVNPLTVADLQKVVAAADAKTVEAYKEAALASGLFDKIPAPAAIAKENQQKEFTDLTLANGARVLYKKTNFKNDEILFRAYSSGGASLVSDADYPAAMVIGAVVAGSGLGPFNSNELPRFLAGKQVSVAPSIGEREEGLRGQSSAKDLETLFQMTNLFFTAPKADPDIFAKEIATRLEAVNNRNLNPVTPVQDALNDYIGPGSIRGKPFTAAQLQGIDREKALGLYKSRFANAANFTFVFVGSFDEAKLRDLAQRYLGTLPAAPNKDAWKNIFPKPRYGAKVEQDFYKGQDERGIVAFYFTQPYEYSVKNVVVASALNNLLDIRLTEDIREKLGGAYSPGVNGGLSREPYTEVSYLISFPCDPKRAPDLVKATLDTLESVKTNISGDDMTKVREQLKRSREEALRTNSFWLSRLVSYVQYGDIDPNDTTTFSATVDSLKASDLQDLAKKVLGPNYLRAVLYPESMKK
ncbi:MAG: hypothetical protein C4332_13960 [Meiothermus sp.]